MDHETICDCPFKNGCQTYNDPMVAACVKGPAGRGCDRINDIHRREHCRAFACKYLSMVLSQMIDGRVSLVAMVSDDLTDRIRADAIIREIAGLVSGGGGGKPDLAEAGGKDASGLEKALERAYQYIEAQLA